MKPDKDEYYTCPKCGIIFLKENRLNHDLECKIIIPKKINNNYNRNIFKYENEYNRNAYNNEYDFNYNRNLYNNEYDDNYNYECKNNCIPMKYNKNIYDKKKNNFDDYRIMENEDNRNCINENINIPKPSNKRTKTPKEKNIKFKRTNNYKNSNSKRNSSTKNIKNKDINNININSKNKSKYNINKNLNEIKYNRNIVRNLNKNNYNRNMNMNMNLIYDGNYCRNDEERNYIGPNNRDNNLTGPFVIVKPKNCIPPSFERLMKEDSDDDEITKKYPISKIYSIDKLSEDKKKCLICQENFKNGENSINLPCIHIFHYECIKKWLKEKKCCPICKFIIN